MSWNVYAQTLLEVNEEWKLDVKDIQGYSLQQIQAVFNYISRSSGMEFRYPQGGCQQRAEMMHMLLNGLNIKHGRVFIFAPVDLEANSNINLEVDDPGGISQNIRWPYHVAPCVSVIDNNGKSQLMVIDPSLNRDAPLPLNDWFAKMRNANVSKYTIVKSDTYFFYTRDNSTIISGDFYKYKDLENPNIISSFDNAVLERELAINDVALFLKEKLDEGYPDKHNEVKTLLSSANSMVALFSSQNNTFSLQDGLIIRSLLENHAKLINEAMKIYTDRVTYWVAKSKDLRTPGKKIQIQTVQRPPHNGQGAKQTQQGNRQFEQQPKKRN